MKITKLVLILLLFVSLVAPTVVAEDTFEAAMQAKLTTKDNKVVLLFAIYDEDRINTVTLNGVDLGCKQGEVSCGFDNQGTMQEVVLLDTLNIEPVCNANYFNIESYKLQLVDAKANTYALDLTKSKGYALGLNELKFPAGIVDPTQTNPEAYVSCGATQNQAQSDTFDSIKQDLNKFVLERDTLDTDLDTITVNNPQDDREKTILRFEELKSNFNALGTQLTSFTNSLNANDQAIWNEITTLYTTRYTTETAVLDSTLKAELEASTLKNDETYTCTYENNVPKSCSITTQKDGEVSLENVVVQPEKVVASNSAAVTVLLKNLGTTEIKDIKVTASSTDLGLTQTTTVDLTSLQSVSTELLLKTAVCDTAGDYSVTIDITYVANNKEVKLSSSKGFTLTASSSCSPAKTDAQEAKELEDKFKKLEDEYDELEEDYEKAVDDNDESDIEKTEDDLDELEEDLDELKDEAEDLEDETSDDDVEKDMEDLIEEIEELIDDIKELLNPGSSDNDGFTSGSGSQSSVDNEPQYIPPPTTKTTATTNTQTKNNVQVVQMPSTIVPTATTPTAQEAKSTSFTQSPVGLAVLIGAIVLLLALIVFLAGVLFYRD